MKHYTTTREAAQVLGLSYIYLLRLIDQGKLKAHKVSNRYFIPNKELARQAAERGREYNPKNMA